MFDVTPLLPEWLGNAGFINYDEYSCTLPIGSWPADKKLKEIGKYFKVQFLEGGMCDYTEPLAATNESQEWKTTSLHCSLGPAGRLQKYKP